MVRRIRPVSSYFGRGAGGHRRLAYSSPRAGIAATLSAAALFALPVCSSGAVTNAGGGKRSHGASTSTCPWVDSTQPIAQRVAEVMSMMTLSDEIDMVEGQGKQLDEYGRSQNCRVGDIFRDSLRLLAVGW